MHFFKQKLNFLRIYPMTTIFLVALSAAFQYICHKKRQQLKSSYHIDKLSESLHHPEAFIFNMGTNMPVKIHVSSARV